MEYLNKLFGNNDDNSSKSSGVNNYFNECHELPDEIIFNNIEEIKRGVQIRIFKEKSNREVESDIYVIIQVNQLPSTNVIDTIDVKSTIDDTIIIEKMSIERIYNVVNINPESLYINKDFLQKIQSIDVINLSDTEKLKVDFKKLLVAKIKKDIAQASGRDLAVSEENTQIKRARLNIEDLIKIITTIESDTQLQTTIKNIRDNFRNYYYIQYFNTVLQYGLGIRGDLKDTILNNYIFLCECLSVTVIAGAIEAGFTAHSWIYNILYHFVRTIYNLLDATGTLKKYILLPAIVVYLYTNIETINYITNPATIQNIKDVLEDILCNISSLFDDNNTITNNASNASNASYASNITVNSANNSIVESIRSNSTFPQDLSINSNALKRVADNLTGNYKLPSCEQNVSLSQGSSLPTICSNQQSQPIDSPPVTPPDTPVKTNNNDNNDNYDIDEGGRRRRKYKTKKHKRANKRNSKKNKKSKKSKKSKKIKQSKKEKK